MRTNENQFILSSQSANFGWCLCALATGPFMKAPSFHMISYIVLCVCVLHCNVRQSISRSESIYGSSVNPFLEQHSDTYNVDALAWDAKQCAFPNSDSWLELKGPAVCAMDEQVKIDRFCFYLDVVLQEWMYFFLCHCPVQKLSPNG